MLASEAIDAYGLSIGETLDSALDGYLDAFKNVDLLDTRDIQIAGLLGRTITLTSSEN